MRTILIIETTLNKKFTILSRSSARESLPFRSSIYGEIVPCFHSSSRATAGLACTRFSSIAAPRPVGFTFRGPPARWHGLRISSNFGTPFMATSTRTASSRLLGPCSGLSLCGPTSEPTGPFGGLPEPPQNSLLWNSSFFPLSLFFPASELRPLQCHATRQISANYVI